MANSGQACGHDSGNIEQQVKDQVYRSFLSAPLTSKLIFIRSIKLTNPTSFAIDYRNMVDMRVVHQLLHVTERLTYLNHLHVTAHNFIDEVVFLHLALFLEL
jgi:hypothetical protein